MTETLKRQSPEHSVTDHPFQPDRGFTVPVIQDSDQHYRALYDHNPSMYFTLAPDGTVRSVNQYGAEQLGYEPEDLIGRSVLGVFAPDDHATVLRQLDCCTANPGTLFEWELQKIRKDGTTLWVKERAHAIRNAGGGLLVLVVCEDITARHQSEMLRKQAEESFRELNLALSRAMPGIARLDLEGRYLTVNDYYAAELGYASAELIGQSWHPTVHPEDRPRATWAYEQLCLRGQAEFEALAVRKDGTLFHKQVFMVRINDAAGQMTGHHCFMRNISARKQAEEELRILKERLQHLITSSPAVVYACRPAGNYEATYVSDNVFQELGYRPQEFIENSAFWADRIHPDDQARVFAEISNLLKHGHLETDYRFRHRDGTYRWMHDRLRMVLDDAGNPLEFIGSWIDVTDRKEAEEALRASQLQVQRFVSEAPVGLVIMDNQRRLLTANRAFCELTGYREEELVGQTYDMYTHPDDLHRNHALTNDFYRGRRSGYTIEKRYVRKTGDTIWVSVRVTRIELPNHPGPLLLAVVQDVSDQKRAAEERERFSRDLHDNILQSLYAVGMQLEASRLANGKSARMSTLYVTQAIDQLNHLVVEVRDFISQLKRGGSHQLDFGEALRQLVSAFSTASHHPPGLSIQEGVLELISPEKAEQLLNIAREALSNSVRHARAADCAISLNRVGQMVRLQIEDNGIGFVPRRKRKQGHGLVNMSARAKKIGARLRLDSSPEKGTCVRVEFAAGGSA